MNAQRTQEILALIKVQPEFPFDVMDIEEDLHVILAHFGILDDYSLEEEFVIKEALLAFIDRSAERV